MEQTIRVLVVDDSAFARHVISRQLQADPSIVVIDQAHDGLEALDKVKTLHPDVLTLDVEMPRMNGLTALEHIMTECPTPVIMLSTLTGRGTDATLQALELGAVDFFLKASTINPTGTGNADELILKVKTAAQVKVTRPVRPSVCPGVSPARKSLPGMVARDIVVIGSSTGGPRALYSMIPSIPADIPAALLLVQHMPPGFTKALAGRLDTLSQISVKEAEAGDILCNGQAFMAPGGYHMVLKKNATIDLNQAPSVCGVRPAVDVTMASAVAVYGRAVTGIVLTGMGSDGTRGSGLIKEAGGLVMVEDASTCTIFGMPRSIIEAGYAEYIVPLPEIAGKLYEMINRKVKVLAK